MIIIENNNNFFTKCDIIYHYLTYFIDPNDSGLRYKMNFIIVGKTNYDNDLRTLISSHKLDRVYIKNVSNRLLPWLSKFNNLLKIITIITAISTSIIGYKQIELSNKVQKIEIINTKK